MQARLDCESRPVPRVLLWRRGLRIAKTSLQSRSRKRRGACAFPGMEIGFPTVPTLSRPCSPRGRRLSCAEPQLPEANCLMTLAGPELALGEPLDLNLFLIINTVGTRIHISCD